MSDSLESPGCVRVKAEPLWDLSASCEPETAGPIERVVKKERDSEGDKSSWGLYNHKVKEELQNVQAGHADHDMERSGSEESNEALWGLNNDKVKEELNAHGGLIDHDIKAKGCESEEGDKPDLWSLYNDHKVKEELVLGPEEFHRPKVTLLCRAGGLSNQTCLVRLEQMQVDMERHTCSIGRNTYKFRHCFLSYEECTEESSTSNKLDAREYGVSTAPLSMRARQQVALEFSVRLERLREPPRASELCPVTAHREPSSVEDLPGNAAAEEQADTHDTRATHFTHTSSSITHEQVHIAPQTYKTTYCCDMCSQQFTSKLTLIRHTRTHTHPEHTCRVSKETFQNSLLLNKHLRFHSAERPYVCRECNKRFATKTNLHKHRRTHTGVKPYKCKVCNKQFKGRHGLMYHERVHSGVKPFKCKQCNKEFIRKYDLVLHERIHSGIKPYKCKVCNKEFIQQYCLVMHERLHSGMKPYKCKECNKEFTRKYDLFTHERIHSGIKPYKCKECNKEFTQQYSLVMHERLHSGMKPYKCKECNKEFTRKYDLVLHERIHCGMEPYKCKECNKQFIHKSSLVKHERSHTAI